MYDLVPKYLSFVKSGGMNSDIKRVIHINKINERIDKRGTDIINTKCIPNMFSICCTVDCTQLFSMQYFF